MDMKSEMEEFKKTLAVQLKQTVKERVNTEIAKIKPQIEQEIFVKLRAERSQSSIEEVNEIKERLEMVEEIRKLHKVRHCQDLADQGVKKNGFYFGDPDGNGHGQAPIKMECDFDRNETKIHHNFEITTEIDRCNVPGCAQ